MDELTSAVEVVSRIYDTVLEDSALEVALQSVVNHMHARSSFLLTADAGSGSLTWAASINVDPALDRKYIEYYGDRDVLVPPALSRPVGKLMTEGSLLDRKQFLSSEVYGEIYEPYDVPHVLVFWTRKTPDRLEALSLQRSHRQGPFFGCDEERYRIIVPHILRALRLRGEFQRVREAKQRYKEIIDRLPFGVLFLNRRKQVIEASTLAEGALRQEDGIRYSAGRVRAVEEQDDRALQHALNQLVVRQPAGLPGATVTARRRAAGRPLTIALIPIRVNQVLMDREPCCMLAILDPDHPAGTPVSLVRTALGLTEAEAALACVLFTGISLREAAERLNVSVNTCKSQLKSVYVKTGCRSHVDLVRMMLTAIPDWRLSAPHCPGFR